MRISTKKGKLKDSGPNGQGGNDYEHPSTNGTITGVEIDGVPVPVPVNRNSRIIIHYDVPAGAGDASGG